MDVNPSSLCESLIRAKTVMSALEVRASGPDASIDDLAEHSVLTTTIRKIEELLSVANEYEAMLVDQTRRTLARIER